MRLRLLLVGGLAVLLAACAPAAEKPIMAEAVGTYTVQEGDTLFSIAEKFGLRPETILYSNYETLQDDPKAIVPGVVLTIPPVDGVVYEWQEGDTLRTVARRFGVDPVVIVAWPGNGLDLAAYEQGKEVKIPAGSRLVIPGGTRPFTRMALPEN